MEKLKVMMKPEDEGATELRRRGIATQERKQTFGKLNRVTACDYHVIKTRLRSTAVYQVFTT